MINVDPKKYWRGVFFKLLEGMLSKQGFVREARKIATEAVEFLESRKPYEDEVKERVWRKLFLQNLNGKGLGNSATVTVAAECAGEAVEEIWNNKNDTSMSPYFEGFAEDPEPDNVW